MLATVKHVGYHLVRILPYPINSILCLLHISLAPSLAYIKSQWNEAWGDGRGREMQNYIGSSQIHPSLARFYT